MIKAGHRWEEIQNYSSAQIKLFMEAAQELEREYRAAALIDMSIATQGSKDGVSKAVRKLESGE